MDGINTHSPFCSAKSPYTSRSPFRGVMKGSSIVGTLAPLRGRPRFGISLFFPILDNRLKNITPSLGEKRIACYRRSRFLGGFELKLRRK